MQALCITLQGLPAVWCWYRGRWARCWTSGPCRSLHWRSCLNQKTTFCRGGRSTGWEEQGDIYEDVSMERGTFLVQQSMRVSD